MLGPRRNGFQRWVGARRDFRTSDSRNNRVVRYILCELEYQDSGTKHDFESDTFGIEHVLPQNTENGWEAFSEEEVDAMVYRIGNMALLEKTVKAQMQVSRRRVVMSARKFSALSVRNVLSLR